MNSILTVSTGLATVVGKISLFADWVGTGNVGISGGVCTGELAGVGVQPGGIVSTSSSNVIVGMVVAVLPALLDDWMFPDCIAVVVVGACDIASG